MSAQRNRNPVKLSIGGLLKAKRLEKNMTLQELAASAELSAAFLSQAERGKATPSLVSLINIANALETDINYFIKPPEATSLVRRADDPVYIDVDSPIIYKRLDARIRNQQMNALIMEIPPDVELPAVHRDKGEDFFLVLEGEITQRIGDDEFILGQGDSVHHNTQVDHSMVNRSGKQVRMLWVGTPVIFPSGDNQED